LSLVAELASCGAHSLIAAACFVGWQALHCMLHGYNMVQLLLCRALRNVYSSCLATRHPTELHICAICAPCMCNALFKADVCDAMKDGYVGLGLQLITIPFALLQHLSLPLSCTAGVLAADDSALVCVVGSHIVLCMSVTYLSVTERVAQMLWRQWRC
jgi:hypothetical protein